MTSPSNSHPGGAAANGAVVDQALVNAYLADNPNLSAGALSAARHFLKWAADRRVAIKDLDAAAVGRFAQHRCGCGRYSAAQLQDPSYITDVRRFLRHLEGAGQVAIPDAVARLGPHLAGFSANLATQGYSRVTYSSRISQARHFAEWALQMRVPREGIDGDLIELFAQHDCQCGIKTKRGKRVAGTGIKDRRRGARAFVAFLRVEGLIPVTVATEPPADPRLADFATWMRRERGATSETIRRYQQELGRWLMKLGSEPQGFTAAAVRSIVLDQGEDRSRSSVRMTITVLRTFLRFMIGQGHCAPSLLLAVPSGVRRRLSTVPKTIPASTIEEIVASCGTVTAVEVRDRAIILLLARMALRAGDIWQLRLADIDWRASRLRLHGKSRRGVLMPLPQDVGDALLAYMGSAPNIAAAATPNPHHPSSQGFVQAFGVLIDTILVCTATALMILLSGVYVPGGELTGTQLTQSALADHIGSVGPIFVAVAIFFFAFTSIIGNYAYSEMALSFLGIGNKTGLMALRCLVLIMVVWGALQAVATVFNLADASMGLMATINLIAILALSGTVVALTKNYFEQRKAGLTPKFRAADHPEISKGVDHRIWD